MKNNLSIVQTIYEYYVSYPHISFDSRGDVAGALFFALQGQQDGNVFAKHALANGAAYAIIDNPQYYQEGGHYILVDDVLETLQELAKFHRTKLTIPIIAITGSNGKTTTKELVYAVLSQQYSCYATQGNFNNHIGVPLSVLSIQPSTEIAVLEMGANHQGEIALLCEIAKPTHGLITNISNAHLEGFGGIAGVIHGKGELYAYLKQQGGVAFINSTDPVLMNLGKDFKNPIYYPQGGDFYDCELLEAKPYVIYKSEQNQVVATHLIGKHHFDNIAAAVCVAKYFGVDLEAAHQAIQAYVPANNRSQLVKKGSNIILLDAYNANPTSMRAALEAFGFLVAAHKVVILGDMNELGAQSIEFHQEIVQLTVQKNYPEVILYGRYMGVACVYNPHALHFKHMEELEAYVKSRNFTHTAILIKGSHSYHLERLLNFIENG